MQAGIKLWKPSPKKSSQVRKKPPRGLLHNKTISGQTDLELNYYTEAVSQLAPKSLSGSFWTETHRKGTSSSTKWQMNYGFG